MVEHTARTTAPAIEPRGRPLAIPSSRFLAASFAPLSCTERFDEVLLLDPETETDLALSGEQSDFAEWSIDACGDSDSDPPLEDDSNIALLIEDVIGTGVADDMLMLQTSELL